VPVPEEEPDCVLVTVNCVVIGVDVTIYVPLKPDGDNPEITTGCPAWSP
jgi:hypothetical protein